MIYLLDVNVLLAMSYAEHVHHARARNWLDKRRALHSPRHVKLATCATTELGFIRVASGPARLAVSVREARHDLRVLKLRERMLFLSDRVIGPELPDRPADGAGREPQEQGRGPPERAQRNGAGGSPCPRSRSPRMTFSRTRHGKAPARIFVRTRSDVSARM